MDATAQALGSAARGINRELLRVFHGDAAAAEQAIEDIMERPEVVEAWATRMLERSAQEAYQEQYVRFRSLVVANEQRLAEDQLPFFTRERLAAFEAVEQEGLRHVKLFRISELPRSIRDAGLRGLVIAYLVATDREGRIAS